MLAIPSPPLQVNWEKYKKAVRRVAFNMIVVSLCSVLSTYPLYVWRGSQCGYELPSFPTTIWHLFVYIITHEIIFYYSHRYRFVGALI